MAHTPRVYGKALLSMAKKEVNLSTDTLKVMLCTSSYSLDQDVHQYKAQVTNEVTGTGYTAGGIALTNVTLVYDASTNDLILDADDISWADSTITARHAVVYDDTPATNKPLLCALTFDSDISSTAAPFQVVWHPSGIARFNAA